MTSIKKHHVEHVTTKLALLAIIIGAVYFGYHFINPVKTFVDANIFKRSAMSNNVASNTNSSVNTSQNNSGSMEMNNANANPNPNPKEFKHDEVDPASLQKFVDPLPFPAVARPISQINGVDYYEIHMSEIKQNLHRDLPATTLWGYGDSYPGVTIAARSGVPIKVKWINDLPDVHILPVDKSIMGADNPNDPEVRTNIHLHGGHVPPESDGNPLEWFGPGKSSPVIDYPNNQPATMLWYHDHAFGITRLNVMAGLAGLYLLRDSVEDKMNLPKDAYEVPIVIQDRLINKDGSLDYPTEPSGAPGMAMPTSASTGNANLPKPSIVPEFFGNIIVVNGKAWPFMEVEPRKYRLRFLNGSNARFYNLTFSNGALFNQIGTEGGFLNKPVSIKNLLLAPAERADIIVDFSKYNGSTIILKNDAVAPFPSGDKVDANTGQIMQFRVTKALSAPDTSVMPITLPKVTHLLEKDATVKRNISLIEKKDNFGRLRLSIDGKDFTDPVTENPKLGATEIWSFVNTTVDTHPMHLHLAYFQILDRRPYDMNQYQKTGKIIFTGPAKKPDANESDWKDTIRATPGEVTRIIVKFTDYAGKYVYHCHILEHEEYDMMRPMDVMP